LETIETAIRLLVIAGARLQDIDAQGRSSSDRAKEWGGEELVAFLKQAEQEYTALQEAQRKHVLEGNWEEFYKLLEFPGLVNIYLSNGNTLLQEAALAGSTSAVNVLIRARANTRMRNRKGQTAVHLAVQSRSSESIEKLVKHGADINARDGEGISALHLAAQSRSIESIEQLAKHGANTGMQNHTGQIAIHLAVQSRSSKSIEMLCQAWCRCQYTR
jgi:ankyrin repeat protein